VELISINHYPTEDEKRRAHAHNEDFVTGTLPESFFYATREPIAPDVGIYPQKLLPDTWNILEQAKLAGRPSPPRMVPGMERILALLGRQDEQALTFCCSRIKGCAG
jgi:hypothetical protein